MHASYCYLCFIWQWCVLMSCLTNKFYWTGKITVTAVLLAVAFCISRSLFWVANISTDFYLKSCWSVWTTLSWNDIIWPWWKWHVILHALPLFHVTDKISEPDFTFDSTDITARSPDDVIHCLYSILRVLNVTYRPSLYQRLWITVLKKECD